MMMPVVEEMAEAYDGRVKIGKVNTDEEQELAMTYGVMSIPSFLFIKDGKVVDQAMGYMPKNILAKKIDNLLD